MKLAPPGSTGWFIQHELRVSWRHMIGTDPKKVRRAIFWSIVAVLVALAIGAPGGYFIGRMDLDPLPSEAIVVIDLAMAFLASIMLAQALGAATLAFHDRGDLDLLMSAPVDPARVLTVRKLVMAFNIMVTFVALLAPFVLMSALLGGRWAWLASLPVLVSIGLFVTTLGVAAAFGLYRVIGPRRTRTVAQVLGAVLGASVFLISQSHLIFDSGDDRSFWGSLIGRFRDTDLPLWARWPAFAATGHVIEFLLTVGVLAAVFFVSARLMGAAFAKNAALVAGAGEPVSRPRVGVKARPFRSGLMRVMIFKELNLILRDPGLMSQVLLQVIYLLPLAFVIVGPLARTEDEMLRAWTTASGAGVACLLGGQIAAGLGWLTMSAEEAPELLSAAPVDHHAIARAKVIAVVVPVMALLLVPASVFFFLSPWVGIATLIGGGACAATIGYVELWTQTPGKRSNFRMRRKGSGSVWVIFLELLLCGIFGLMTTLLAMLSPFTLIPAVLLVVMVLPFKKDKWLERYA